MSEMESQLEECGVCHALHPYSELSCFDDTLICADCLEDSTVICGRCGERIWRDDDQGNEDSGHLCQSCYDRYYTHWPRYYSRPAAWEPAQDPQASYIEDLKSVASYYGTWPEDIDEMLADGVTPEEIEELLNGA